MHKTMSIFIIMLTLTVPHVIKAQGFGAAGGPKQPPAISLEESGVKKYYPDGQLMSEYFYIDGKLDGICKDYYKNGQVMFESIYVKNKLHGVSKAYYMNGKVKTMSPYKNGRLHGTVKQFHRNEKIKQTIKYKNGQKLLVKTYNKKGKLLSKKDLRPQKKKKKKKKNKKPAKAS